MMMATAVVGLYGLFSLVGGAIGYVKAGSRASLAAGSASGLLLLLCAFGIQQGRVAAAIGSLAIALALGGRFIGTWRRTRRLMPDLLMILLSLSTVAAVGRWLLAVHG